jgi:heme-degrading monooxygenase HmoA
MHARLTYTNIQSDKVDEATSLYEGTIQALQSQPGFAGALLLGDRGTGRSISITLWESAEAEQASTQSGFYREQVARFAALFTAEPEMDSLEVLLQG